jgi:hypothetical protein
MCSNYLPRKISSIYFYDNRQKSNFFQFITPNLEFRVKMEKKRRKSCIVERENAFFKSSLVDEYHLPQMNSEKVFFLGAVTQKTFLRRATFRIPNFKVMRVRHINKLHTLWPIELTNSRSLLLKNDGVRLNFEWLPNNFYWKINIFLFNCLSRKLFLSSFAYFWFHSTILCCLATQNTKNIYISFKMENSMENRHYTVSHGD